MKVLARRILVVVLALNIVLVLLSVALTRQALNLNPMKGSLVQIDDTAMHVIESIPDTHDEHTDSVTDALVLTHGASTSALDFSDNLLPALSERYRVVAIDRPGHGYSDRGASQDMHNPQQQAKVMLDTLAKMNINSPVIVGHSWAGSVVLAALLAEHDQVKPAAGILIAGVTHPHEREDSLPTKLTLTPYFGRIFSWQYLSPVGRLMIAPTVERLFAPDEVPDDYISKTGLYLSLRPDTYRHNALDRSNLNDHLVELSRHYSHIKVPVLSIAASADSVVRPVDHHDKLINTLVNVQSVVIAGSGHSPHHTHTDKVIASIESFVDKLTQ